MAKNPERVFGHEPRRDYEDEDEFLKLRRNLAARIPVMLDLAVSAYERIASDVDTTDPKAISSMHSAAKAALAHIEQVIKVAEWVLDVPEAETTRDTGDAEALLQFARRSLKSSRLNSREAPGDPHDVAAPDYGAHDYGARDG